MRLDEYFIICIIFITILHKSETLPVDDENEGSLPRRYGEYNEDFSGPGKQQNRVKRDCHRYIYDVKFYNHCPPRGTKTKANQDCYSCRAPYTYHCRKNRQNNYVDGCAIPTYCPKGTEATLYEDPNVKDGHTVHCDMCKDGYFNDKLNHSSNSLVKCEKISFCPYQYTVCVHGTPSSDARCSCNYKKGFKPSNISFDCPEEEKPDCVKKICLDGERLDGPPDYECIPENGKRERTTEETSNEVPTSKPAESTTIPSSTERSSVNPTPSNGESKSNKTGAIVGGSIAGAVVLGAFIVWLIINRKKRGQPTHEPQGSTDNSSTTNNKGQPTHEPQGTGNSSTTYNKDLSVEEPIALSHEARSSAVSPTTDDEGPSEASSNNGPSAYDENTDENRLNRYKTLLDDDCCKRILNSCYDKIKSDLKPNAFAAKYSSMFMVTMPEEHVTLLSELKSMEESRIHDQERNVKLLVAFLTADVNGYLNFKKCLPEHLLHLIEDTEDQYFEIKSKEEDKNANEAQDDEPLMGENGNNE